ncbi:MAG: M48 family metallopeptidase [Methanomicrobiaceae archaeon]|nr:M48 family metallopeptidase [Methanomicrobiaceae archaeon]
MPDHTFKTIIIRKDIKNSRIRIGPDCTVYVTAPHDTDTDRIIESRKEWIQKKICELNSLASAYETGDGSFLYNGMMWHPVFSERGEVSFLWPDVYYNSVKELRKNVARELRADISSRLEHHSKKMGVDYGRISLRNQKTRWGSCSGRGNLNFNLRAMALPETVRDYLVVHELAHRVEMNHSPSFWRIVSVHYPGYREAERDLKHYWIVIGRNRIWNSILEIQVR